LLPRGATSGRSASVIRDASLWMASQSSWDGGGVIGGGAASQGGGLGEDCASQMSAYSVAPHGRSALDGAPVDDPARDGARYHLLEIDVLTVLRHVCLALQYMHARGLAHLDVKPANILVVYDGGPGMCDINGDWLPEVTALGGIASLDLAMVSRVADAAAADAPAPALDLLLAEGSGGGGGGGATGEAREGGDGSVAVSLERLRGLGWVRYKLGDLGQEALISSVEVTEGDSRYLSRELMEGSCENLAAADIFALGLTLYELASGRPLPTGDEEYHSLRDGVLPPEHMPQLSARVQDMLVAMVEQHPGARPTAADILSHPLVAALENPAAYFVNAAGQVVLPTDAAPQPMAAGVPSAAAAGGGSSDVGAPPALDDGSGGERRGHVSDDSYLVTSVTSDVPATLRQPVAASTGVDDEDGVDEDEDDGGVSDGDDLPAWVDAAAFPMLHAVLAGGSGSDGGGGGGSGMSSVESGAGGAPGGALPHVRLADTVLFSLKSSSPGSGSGRFTTAALGARRKRRGRRGPGGGGGGGPLGGGPGPGGPGGAAGGEGPARGAAPRPPPPPPRRVAPAAHPPAGPPSNTTAAAAAAAAAVVDAAPSLATPVPAPRPMAATLISLPPTSAGSSTTDAGGGGGVGCGAGGLVLTTAQAAALRHELAALLRAAAAAAQPPAAPPVAVA